MKFSRPFLASTHCVASCFCVEIHLVLEKSEIGHLVTNVSSFDVDGNSVDMFILEFDVQEQLEFGSSGELLTVIIEIVVDDTRVKKISLLEDPVGIRNIFGVEGDWIILLVSHDCGGRKCTSSSLQTKSY